MKQYVQHISGQGEKRELVKEIMDPPMWCVMGPADKYVTYWYPKSEYRLCEPPERWVDVTAECTTCNALSEPHGSVLEDKQHVIGRIERGYRLRKVRVFGEAGQNILSRFAFIVEKREP